MHAALITLQTLQLNLVLDSHVTIIKIKSVHWSNAFG